MKTNGNAETAGIEKPRQHNFLRLWGGLVQRTFPFMEEEVGELGPKARLFVTVCETVVKPETFKYAKWKGVGRPPAKRMPVFKAFLFKAVHDIPTTKELVERILLEPQTRRLCGWADPGEVPCESKFSEINKEFAEMGFTEEWFDEFVRPYAVDEPGGTLSLDSAPIPVRVKAANSKRRRLSPHIRLVGAAREIDLHAARLERLQEQDRARHVVGRRRRLARQHLVALHGDGCHQHAVVFVLVEPRIVGRGTIYCARLGRDALLRVRRGRATLLAALPPPGTPSSGGWSARPSSRR